MSSPTIAISVVADVQRAQAGFNATGDSATRMGREVESAGHSFDELGEKAGTNASRASQLAGALGDIAGTATDSKGAIGAVARAVEGAAPFVMVAAGAFDILELALTSTALASVRNAAATVASRTAMVAGAVATYALAAAQTALDVAMDANPIGLVVIAIAALVAGLIYAYKHSETFRDIVNSVFTAITDTFTGVVAGIKTAIDFVVSAFQFVVDLPGKLANIGKDILSNLINGILDGIPGLRSAVEFLADLLPGSVKSALGLGDLKVSGTVSASSVAGVTTSAATVVNNTTIVAPSGNAAEIGRVHASYLANRDRVGGLAQ